MRRAGSEGERRARRLDDRLEALQQAAALGESIADPAALRSALAVVDRAGERLGHGLEHTVVALAGATGSGKSSLFNALSGAELSQAGVLRPTTSRATASTWGADASPLLDWLDVPTRHAIAATGELDGLVLLDLPDHDSTAAAHRIEVDRLVELVDLVVWVLDPQKYADAAVHRRYLAPLATHDDVLLVVLNQIDRLTGPERTACLGDLRRLLAQDGLPQVSVEGVSARTWEGVDALKGVLSERVSRRLTALDRLAVDVDRAAAALSAGCGSNAGALAVPAADRAQLVDALSSAAGVDRVVAAVDGSYRAQAGARTGWPLTRWLRRLRPDPLRRLHLGTGEPSAARTSLPPATPVQSARVTIAVRTVVDRLTEDLPAEWGSALRVEAAERSAQVPERLDAAIAGTDTSVGRRPYWWAFVGLLQQVLMVVAVVGGLWLAGLAALSYLRMDLFSTPDLGRLPLPTVLLAGGLILGLLVAFVAAAVAGVGARRRAARVRRRLHHSVAEVADSEVLQPVEQLAGRHRDFCGALARARA